MSGGGRRREDSGGGCRRRVWSTAGVEGSRVKGRRRRIWTVEHDWRSEEMGGEEMGDGWNLEMEKFDFGEEEA